jgi:2-oxoisovalerate dehydrogenase E2 component (dihydrolipoyl transacylase)
MATPILMPQLGESVTEGTVARWLKQEGERVERDEPLLEISTDKVNADMPSPVAGVLVRRSVQEGAVVPIGAELAQIDEIGSEHAGAPTAPNGETEHPAAAASLTVVGGDGSSDEGGGERRRYSPLVRKLAAEHAVDLAQLKGTGLGGRITKDDVLAFVAQRGAAPAVKPETSGRVTREEVLSYVAAQEDGVAAIARTRQAPEGEAPEKVQRAQPVAAAPLPASFTPVVTVPVRGSITPAPEDEIVPLTPMRRGIAEHMSRSLFTAPQATTVTEVDMTRLVRWRERHRDAVRAREGVEITYVAYVVQATIAALKAHPYLNASWGDEGIILKGAINIGIAVGMDDGLLVPVIHRADERSLVGIARAVADLAARARARRLTVDELQGGTFTVNNTGAFGSIVSTPVINQPQAAILSMEAIVKRPVVVDDAIAIRSMMNVCLSFDHRIVDGLMAGRFTQMVRQHLEQFPLPEAF